MADQHTIEELQHLRATGKALPDAPRPDWLNHLSRTQSGLYPVPEESLTSGGSPGLIAAGIALIFIGALLLFIAFGSGWDFQVWSFVDEGSLTIAVLGAGASLIGLVLVMSAGAAPRSNHALEISQYPLSPGDGALLMIPHRKHQPPVTGAWLTLRERIKLSHDSGSSWHATPLEVTELTLTKTGEGLYSTNILIPEDAVPSYEVDEYQLQWGIEVERRYSGGTTIRSFYLLWVRPAPTNKR